jgi:carbon monoxide dehydrogenase subunit G
MDMQGSRQLAITQQQAWDALNDPAVLKACIPGCDKVEPTGENQYAIGMALKVGPVSAKFAGKITLTDIVAPTSYAINFEGQGGAAGFGKGKAAVVLTANDAGCELNYTVQASVGGKIAQLGQRLIDGAAKSMAEDFFKRFDQAMQAAHPQAPATEDAIKNVAGGADDTRATASKDSKIPVWVWIAAVIALGVGFAVMKSQG